MSAWFRWSYNSRADGLGSLKMLAFLECCLGFPENACIFRVLVCLRLKVVGLNGKETLLTLLSFLC